MSKLPFMAAFQVLLLLGPCFKR